MKPVSVADVRLRQIVTPDETPQVVGPAANAGKVGPATTSARTTDDVARIETERKRRIEPPRGRLMAEHNWAAIGSASVFRREPGGASPVGGCGPSFAGRDQFT